MPKLAEISLSLPFGIGSVKWTPDPAEPKAAWELYVELVTRIAVQPLGQDEGLLREALNSLHSLFGTTRQILRAAGPKVGASRESVGGIAIAVLNDGLRPFLSKWHPLLETWEAGRPAAKSPRKHERAWEKEPELRKQLEALRGELKQYAQALARIAGI